MKKLLSLFLASVFIISAVPIAASADEVEEIIITVTEGESFSTVFNDAAKLAKDDTSGKQYKLIIPSGTYYAESQLQIYSNTTVDMTSGAKIVNSITGSVSEDLPLIRYANASYFENANGGNGYRGYNAGGNIALIGGTYDANGENKAIFKFGHMSGVTVEGVTMTNVYKKHYIEFAASENVLIKDCKFTDYQGPWGGNDNVEAVQIDAAVDEHFRTYKKNDDTPCKNVTVTGCTFKNLKRGVGAHSSVAGKSYDNVQITNNSFENIEGYAIIASNFINSSISGNTITNCGAGILFRTCDGSHKNFYAPRFSKYVTQSEYVKSNSKIENNTISVIAGYKKNFVNINYGIQLWGEIYTVADSKKYRSAANNNYVCPEGDFRIAGVTVKGNNITLNVKGYAIWLQGAVKNKITGNTVNVNLTETGKGGNGDFIRLVSSKSNSITNNTLANVTKKGSLDKELTGICLMTFSNSNTISGNSIKGAKKDGIKADSSTSNKILSNTIVSPGRDGIRLYKAKKSTVTSNTIKKPANDGILVESSASSTITSNTVNMAREGINLKSSASVKIVSNKLTNSTNDGIKLEKSNSAKIDKNTLTTQKRDGIFVANSTKIVITNNKIKSSTRYGINALKKQIKKDSKNKITKSGKRARSWK